MNSLISRIHGNSHIFPPEIMARIFLMCIPNPAKPSTIQSPLNVSHTCRLWRDIALSSPLLWTQLRLNSPAPPQPYTMRESDRDLFTLTCVRIMDRLEEALRTWIRRSGMTTTLSIGIQYSTVLICPETRPIFRELVSLLMNELPRWENVTINFPDKAMELDMRLSNMVALRSLRAWGSSVRDGFANFEIDLTLSSNIQHLELQGFRSIEFGETHFRFLTQLRLNLGIYPDPKECLDMCIRILKQAPNLVVLKLESSPNCYNQTLSAGDFIILENIKELSISKMSSFHIEFLRWLTLPTLVGMDLWSTRHIRDRDQVVFSLLRRSCPPLERLRLFSCTEGSQALISALQLLPTLKKLDLRLHPSREFLRNLAIDGSDGLCPRLRVLAIADRKWPGDCVELLVDILVSRTRKSRKSRKSRKFEVFLSGLEEQFNLLLADARVQRCITDGLIIQGLEYNKYR